MATDRNEPGGEAESAKGLSIYGYPQCPFCRRVLDLVSSLGLEIPLRNTLEDSEHQQALQAAMGRATVPVLLIEGESGDPKWLPESADIMRYLVRRFGAEDRAGVSSILV